MALVKQTTNKITLTTLYDTYANCYKPSQVIGAMFEREEYLEDLYEKYASDYRRGVNSRFFAEMLRTIDEGNVDTDVFVEYEQTNLSVYDTCLSSLFTQGLNGKPSLYSLLRNALSEKEFAIDIVIHKAIKVVVTVYWSIEERSHTNKRPLDQEPVISSKKSRI